MTGRNQHRKVVLALNGVLNVVLSICCLLIDVISEWVYITLTSHTSIINGSN